MAIKKPSGMSGEVKKRPADLASEGVKRNWWKVPATTDVAFAKQNAPTQSSETLRGCLPQDFHGSDRPSSPEPDLNLLSLQGVGEAPHESRES